MRRMQKLNKKRATELEETQAQLVVVTRRVDAAENARDEARGRVQALTARVTELEAGLAEVGLV